MMGHNPNQAISIKSKKGKKKVVHSC